MKASTNRRALDGKSPGRRARDGTPRFDNHRLSRRWSPRTCYLCQPRDGAHGRPSSVPPNSRRGWEGQRRVTPRQTCPRPNGFGRNLRSKTRWFTGFCNSHQVSHFATFFIDARAEISVAESRSNVSKRHDDPRSPRWTEGRGTRYCSWSLAQSAPGFVRARRRPTRWEPRSCRARGTSSVCGRTTSARCL